MRARYLVDRSALARMPHAAVRERLGPFIEAGEAATCAIIDLEVLFSARNRQERERIRARRKLAYVHVPMTEEIFERAVEVQGELARLGRHRLPIPDLIVAATAEVAGLLVLQYDADFDRIAKVTGQPVDWVVPRGSVWGRVPPVAQPPLEHQHPANASRNAPAPSSPGDDLVGLTARPGDSVDASAPARTRPTHFSTL